MTSEEPKVRDLLRSGELDAKQVVATGTSDRLFDRKARRPGGCSARLYASLGVKDPLATQDKKAVEKLAAADRFRAIDKQKKKADTRPKAAPPPKPVRYAETIPKPAPVAPSANETSAVEPRHLNEPPERPALPIKQQQKKVGRSGRPRTVRAAPRRWEAAPSAVKVVEKSVEEEVPTPAPPRPEAPGMEGLFSGGNTRPRLARKAAVKKEPTDG